MIYVSFVEILFKSAKYLSERYGDYTGNWINVASFFGGILLIGLIDNFVPSAENPHETHSEAETQLSQNKSISVVDLESSKATPVLHCGSQDHGVNHHKFMRIGFFVALAIGIHNFPEGFATFLAALESPSLGVPIAIAIALHNIPEGISVSVPILHATRSRMKALIYSALSGMSEPIGAVIGYLAIRFYFGSETVVIPSEIMGILFGGVAGIMVYISLDELIPISKAYGKGHDSIYGIVAGMLVMALSLSLMK